MVLIHTLILNTKISRICLFKPIIKLKNKMIKSSISDKSCFYIIYKTQHLLSIWPMNPHFQLGFFIRTNLMFEFESPLRI